MKLKFFTSRNAHPTTQPAPQPTTKEPILLWKDSEYKKSLEVFKKYFSTLVFMGTSKDEFYNKVEELGLTGRIGYSPADEQFENFPEALVTMLITNARNLANAYIITTDNAYRSRFVKLYNTFAEILDPSNKISDDFEDLKSAVEMLERLFKEPNSHLL